MRQQSPNEASLQQQLHKQFGFDDFQPGQLPAIQALLEGRDVLTVMPTGGGKSLIYQFTALLLPGVTIVVSPLIALMQDQLESLETHGQAAAVISSHYTAKQIDETLQDALLGELKILYVTPERFQNPDFCLQVSQLTVSLFVVDEAHCISEWGHDFRPAYTHLEEAVTLLGRPPVIALTATGSPRIRENIADRLALEDPLVVVHGIDRPELFYEVRDVQDEKEDFEVLADLFNGSFEKYGKQIAARLKRTMQGPGIIYTATTQAAHDTAYWLQSRGIEAVFYHGQQPKAEREQAQQDFMEGRKQVIVATNAFGMGIDKADVRFVIHRDIPASIEAYYQESGRAGRDGQTALCCLIYRQGDLGRAAFLAAGSDEKTKEYERGRVAQVRGYAELQDCRRKHLLEYFAEPYDAERCGFCDNDLNPPERIQVVPADTVDVPYTTGKRVRHEVHGEGVVQQVTPETTTVLFDDSGSKSLSNRLILENDLLIMVA